ncbi:MAG: IPT/TIG domain-containing protein [Thermodesulfovibrionales bacterium]
MFGKLMFTLLLAIIIMVLAVPGYPAEKTVKDGTETKTEKEASQPTEDSVKKQINDISKNLRQFGETIETLKSKTEEVKKQADATDQNVNKIGWWGQSLATGAVLLIAILVIFIIAYFSRLTVNKDFNNNLDTIQKSLTKVTQPLPAAVITSTNVDKLRGLPWGGEIIRISGRYLDNVTQVWIGEQRARVIGLERAGNDWVITAETPPAPGFKEGNFKDSKTEVRIKVETAWGSNESGKNFFYYWPPLVVQPYAFSSDIEENPVIGEGFGPGTKVTVENTDVEVRYVSSELLMVKLIPSSIAKPVDVKVFREDKESGQAKYKHITHIHVG